MNKKLNIYEQLSYRYLDGDTGCGKTTWAIKTQIPKYIFNGNSVMLVVPSIKLANEIEARSNGQIKAIHSNNRQDETTVLSDVVQAIQDSKKQPQAIVICEASYLNGTQLFKQLESITSNWVLIKDEPRDPLVIKYHKHVSLDALKMIREYIGEFIDCGSKLLLSPRPRTDFSPEALAEFNPLSKKEQKERAKQKTIRERLSALTGQTYDDSEDYKPKYQFTDIDCALTGNFAEFKQFINNPFYEVLVDKDVLEEQGLKYSVFQLPQAYSMFGEVIFMKANFQDSFIYTQWQERGVKWSPINKQFDRMPSSRMKIHYLYDNDVRWSKTFREKTFKGVTNFNVYLEWIREELKDQKFVYVANNGYDEEDLKLMGKRMPAECHGLNEYRDYTNVVLSGSYLVYRGDEPFYNHYNSSTTDALGMRQTQYHIQQIARTDIRNYQSKLPINVYVPTMTEALSLLNYFQDATLVNAAKTEFKLNKKYQKIENKDTQPTHSNQTCGIGAYSRLMTVDLDQEEDVRVLTQGLEPHEFINAKTKNLGNKRIDFLLKLKSSVSSKGLAKGSAQYKNAKLSLPWISTGIYNEGDSLSKDLCQGSTGIGFDLDDTDITDKEIAQVMKQWEYVQYTTFSHSTVSKKRRLRIYAPYDKPVSMQEHSRIVKWFMERFDQICERDINFDKPKSEPYAKLFVPHAESDIKWVKRKNNRATVAIETDYILGKMPREPKIKEPTQDDLVQICTNLNQPVNDQDDWTAQEIVDFVITHKPYFGDHVEFLKFVTGAKASNISLAEIKQMKNMVSHSKTDRDVEQMYKSAKIKGINNKIFVRMLKKKLKTR